MPFGEKIPVDVLETPLRGRMDMRKIKYVKPGVVGGSSVHPC